MPNKEQYELKKKYYKEYEEKRKEKKKEWYVMNKERLINVRKVYVENNRERIAERQKLWYEKNKERVAEDREKKKVKVECGCGSVYYCSKPYEKVKHERRLRHVLKCLVPSAFGEGGV